VQTASSEIAIAEAKARYANRGGSGDDVATGNSKDALVARSTNSTVGQAMAVRTNEKQQMTGENEYDAVARGQFRKEHKDVYEH